ncbi:MAG: type II toxin-antitoxin system prevent-host-death family antitoxin [Amaricoccus sp.]|uniref:type II toxin-antitoxin system prevent-host-death family antitoxin n=1 Tax=Amaricoccus sp. TaxID=1872485 RepID=UPI0039E59560
MPTVDSVIFQRGPEEFLHRAQREPVEIARHGRRAFVLMSVDHYDWLRATAQRRHRTAEAVDVVIDAVECAEMDAGFTPLDALLR